MSDIVHLRDQLGCWAEIRARDIARFHRRPALFLDRDGVVIEEKNYLAHPEGVRLVDGAAETIAAVNAADFAVVLITNQSGIARGYYTWADFAAVMARLDRDLAARGAALDFVYACGFHDSAPPPLGVANHAWRKPNPGMLLAAAEDGGLDLGRSLIIGDRASDLAAGRSAGLRRGQLVASGYGAEAGEQQSARALATSEFAVEIVERLVPADIVGALSER